MKRNQIIIISGASLLLVLLFILPKTKAVSEASPVTVQKESPDELKTHVDAMIAQLDSSSLAVVENIKKKYELSSNKSEKIVLLDSLIAIWDFYRKPLVGAFYAEEKAGLAPEAESFKEVADRYFFSTSHADEHLKTHLFEKSELFYNKFLEKDSTDQDVKINLAVCYVESSKDPMKGITLLKEVLAKDPNNVKAHLNLGYFSVKSGQFDKAIERFETVVKIDPTHIEAFLYLGDVYESKGDILKAIENYEKYKASLSDKTVAIEVQAYIEKLKNKV